MKGTFRPAPAATLAAAALTLGISTTAISAEDYVGQILNVRDVGIETNFADYQMGHFNRGRALLCDDFDRDGLKDCYVGNPGDATFVMRNVDGETMTLNQVLIPEEEDPGLSWGGCLLDFDNDGFTDIFGTQGGNECDEFDRLWHNQGDGTFIDVAAEAGVLGPVNELGFPQSIASASCAAADINGDGLTDVLVNNNSRVACDSEPRGDKINVLWLNRGDGTFRDITEASGLAASAYNSRHSFFFDADGDGDPDLYESNYQGPNVLWINRIDEVGIFVDETAIWSAPDEDLAYPWATFASCPGEMNGDDLEDIVAFQRGGDRRGGPVPIEHDCGVESTNWAFIDDPGVGPYEDGHAIFVHRPEGFVNEVDAMGVGANFYGDNGVMGSQLGDLNGDGWLDIYIANGGPTSGAPDQWWVSDPLLSEDPFYTDESQHINFPAPDPGGVMLPEFPYRGHGTAILDIDGDGATELLVVNGGPDHIDSPLMQEPNRWYEIDLDSSYSSLRVRLVGDGLNVSKDAIGARVCVTVSNDTSTWEKCRWVRSGSCFSASNGFELFFGLKNATSIDDVEIRWRDGFVQHATATIGDNLVVRR